MPTISNNHETAVRVPLIAAIATALALAGCAANHPAPVAAAQAPTPTVVAVQHSDPVSTVAAAAAMQLDQLVAKAEQADRKAR